MGPLPIIERIGKIAHYLAFPYHLQRIPNVFHVSMLWIFLRDAVAYQFIDIDDIELQPNVSYEEKPIAILDHMGSKLFSKVVILVRIQWRCQNTDEPMWESDDDMREK